MNQKHAYLCAVGFTLQHQDMKNATQEFINAMFNEARANGVDLSTEELQRAYFAANKTKWAYALLASK